MADDHCMECEPCNSNCCKGKWRCSVNRKCQQCRSEGYTLHKDSTELDELMNPSNNCSRYRCDPCPYDDEGDGQNWYKCGELDGQCDASYYQYSPDTLSTYTQTQINNHCDNECGICFDPRYGYKHCSCFGYDKRESDCTREGLIGYNKCNGHNGEWFEKCCSACSGYTYESDISDSNNGISCSKCENSCPNVTKKWKCLCSRTARCSAVNYPDTAAKTGAGWKSTSCTDCSGTYYKNECDTANGYSLQGGACVKSNTEYHFLFNDDGDGDDDYTTSKVTLRSSSSYVEVESYADTYSNNVQFTYSCTGDFDLDRSQTHWDTSNNEFQFVTKTTPTRGDTAVCTFTQNGSGKKITLKLDVACPAGWKETACSSDQIQTDYADGCYKCEDGIFDLQQLCVIDDPHIAISSDGLNHYTNYMVDRAKYGSSPDCGIAIPLPGRKIYCSDGTSGIGYYVGRNSRNEYSIYSEVRDPMKKYTNKFYYVGLAADYYGTCSNGREREGNCPLYEGDMFVEDYFWPTISFDAPYDPSCDGKQFQDAIYCKLNNCGYKNQQILKGKGLENLFRFPNYDGTTVSEFSLK